VVCGKQASPVTESNLKYLSVITAQETGFLESTEINQQLFEVSNCQRSLDSVSLYYLHTGV